MCFLLTGKPKCTKKINLKVKFSQYIFCQNVENRKNRNFNYFEPILAIIAEDDKKSYSCKMLKLVIYCNPHNKLKAKQKISTTAINNNVSTNEEPNQNGSRLLI